MQIKKVHKILLLIENFQFEDRRIFIKSILDKYPDRSNLYLFITREINKDISAYKINHPNIYVPNSAKKNLFHHIIEIKNLIQKESINVIHTYNFRTQTLAILLKIIWFHEIKIIFQLQNHIFESNKKDFLNHLICKIFLYITQSLVWHYIVTTKFARNKLLSIFKINQNKIIVLYNFIDEEKYKRVIKTSGTNSVFTIGFAGEIVEDKGWQTFVKAVTILNKKYQNLACLPTRQEFLIAGTGPEFDLLKKISMKIPNIQILGDINNMESFYPRIDCFILPLYNNELTDMKIIEAMSMTVPVIASDIDSLNEIIINSYNGLTFKVKDASDLAIKIEMLMKDETLYKTLIDNGIKSSQKYYLSKYIENLYKIYQSNSITN